MDEKTKTEIKRFVANVPMEDYKKLRANLVMQNRTVTDWLITTIKDYIDVETHSASTNS